MDAMKAANLPVAAEAAADAPASDNVRRKTVRNASLTRILFLFVLSGASLGHGLVGNWTSYTHLEDIRDLENWKGNLYAATGGGIIRLAPDGSQRVFRNTEGLRDVGIAALASDPQGDLYATSDLGYLYRYRAASDDWEILSTSYRGAGWKMRERALTYRSGYLVLGSQKGLSFFNLKKKVADANVSKMESVNGPLVNSVLFVGDTLFAGTDRGIFRVTLHLEKLLTDPAVNIFNPAIWAKVPGTDGFLFLNPDPGSGDSGMVEDSLRMVDAINAAEGADAPEFSHGFLYHGKHGIGSEFSGSEVAGRDARISAYDSSFVDGKAIAPGFGMEAIGYLDGKYYTGVSYGLFRVFPEYDGYGIVPIGENIPKDDITAIKANRYGVHAFATPSVYRLNWNRWDSIPGLVVKNDPNDTKNRGAHAFDVKSSGEIYVGTWGSGFHAFRNGKLKVHDAENSCMATALATAPNYPVIWSQAGYKDKGIWFTNYVVGKPYRIGYYDFAKETVACFEPATTDTDPRNVQVVGDSVLAVVTERAVEAFRILDNGAGVTLDPVNRLRRLAASGSQTLAGKADRFGNFWVTTESSNLLYIPSIVFHADSVRAYHTLEGFTGTACKHLEIDPQGHLWAGCTDGGVFEITPGKDSLSHAFRHYGLNDGLVSEVIFALDVNPENGEVWISTEKGLARYESASRPTKPNLAQAKVFPNPFLPKHEGVVFANLSPGSEIQVLTQSGSVVYHKSLLAGTGDQIRWDGRNRAGARIREGVYFYVIRSPKEIKNGKIIVAR